HASLLSWPGLSKHWSCSRKMGLTLSLCPAELAHHGLSFDSKFEIDEGNVLGTGKFSTVYMCFRRGQPNRRFALKAISTYTGDDASMNRILEEINIMKVIEYHPSIIRLVDMDQSTSNTIRLVLELCEGGELYDRIQQKRYYSESDTKLLVKNLLEAVCFIHSKGIMHRDLKPENILLVSKVSNTDIKVSDFGLAKLSKDWPRKLPRSTSICGSDFYLAPEVIKQEELPCESTRCPLSARSIFISQG
ncbi:Calcium-dependent protein kinase 20 (OsCDPK20) (OsCPK20), partial [Durusdinium trenchii]